MKKITKIEEQVKRKGRYNIFINDDFALGVDEDVVLKYHLTVGKEVTEDYVESVVRAEETSKAFGYAVNLLSFRSRSTGEIRSKMKQKGYEDTDIEIVIEKLLHYGYLNDKQFATQFVHDKQKFKKAGRNLLKQELFYKGVDKEIIEEVLGEKVNLEEEYERALELATKKARTLTKDDRTAKYRKLSGLLVRKGYSFDLISKVIKEVI